MKKIFAVIILSAVSLAGAGAQVLVSYNFTGATGDQVSQPVASFDPDLTASVMTRGSGITASAAGGSISSTGFTTGVIDLNDYYSFTLTPGVGVTMDLGTLTFAERRSGTGIRDFSIRTSLDGFATDVFTAAVPDDTATRDQSFVFGSAFDAVTGPITIRIYGYTAESAAGTWRLTNTSSGAQNFQLTGTAVVPEPTSAAMIFVGAGLVAWGVRRKRTLI